MKKVLFTIAAFLFLSNVLLAQKSFEGKIVYEIKYLGDGADQFAAFAPTGYTFYFLDQNMRMEMQGGMAALMMGTILVKGKEEETYMVKDNEETVYKFTKDENEEEAEAEMEKPVITKEDETIEILGYECQKYKVVTMADENKVIQYLWVTHELDLKRPKGSGENTGGIFLAGIEGLALKTMTNMDMMGMTITTVQTVSEIDKTPPAKSLFEIPDGYEVKDFDPDIFGGR